jgi:hypothetical protein
MIDFERWKSGLTSPHFWDPQHPDESNPPICTEVNGRQIAERDRCPRCAVFYGPRPGERYQCEVWKPHQQLTLFGGTI